MISHCLSFGVPTPPPPPNFSPWIYNASLLAIIFHILPIFSMRVVSGGWQNDCFMSSPIASFAEISRAKHFPGDTRGSDVMNVEPTQTMSVSAETRANTRGNVS